MTTGAAFLTLTFLISGVGAYRSKESIISSNAATEEKNAAEGNMIFSAKTRDFCASPRCNGYSDSNLAGKKQLKFRFPNKGLDADPMGRAEIAKETRFEGYYYGVLKECKPVTNLFSYSHDWATNMQTNMREDIWPNNPGDEKYKCAEKCKLKIFNEKQEQLNKGSEPFVYVERDGNSGDIFSKISSLGWSPDTCVVGNALQTHWWAQHDEASEVRGTNYPKLMVDTEGLPAFPSWQFDDTLRSILMETFEDKFCALTNEQKISVTKRVTKHRPNPLRYGQYYGPATVSLQTRNYFPRGFPTSCSDGWTALNAEGVSK